MSEKESHMTHMDHVTPVVPQIDRIPSIFPVLFCLMINRRSTHIPLAKHLWLQEPTQTVRQ
jgi:hypothetical protein